MRQQLNDALEVVKPVGWLVLGIGLGAGLVAAFTQWRELAVLAFACLILLVLAAPFLLGRTAVAVDLRLQPERVAAGESVAAGVVVVNRASSRLVPTTLEVPVGSSIHRYGIGSLPGGATHEESFTIRTERRGVIAVGPAMTRRGDPVGLFSRDMVWTPVREVLVRPHLLPLESLGAGLLRDLEGVSTDAVSQSDLAFHALREYVPGDDLRHVHWRSSARAGELLVRQYHDTRRNHATVVVDADPAAYPTVEGFELAASVAASLLMCAAREEYEVSLAAGSVQLAGLPAPTVLDGTCRLDPEPGAGTLSEQVAAALGNAPETSVLLLVTGGGTDPEAVARATVGLPGDTRVVVLRAAPGEQAGVVRQHGNDLVTVGRLGELPGLMAVAS